MMRVYPWQQALWTHLCGYLELQRIPQALLVSGPEGLGKRHLANLYAQALLCPTPLAEHYACGHCQSCKLFAAQSHPDYLVIEPEEPGKAIGIDRIRQLTTKLALKPQFDTQRVVIIQPADLMNNASANAFLKCLEEPTERTTLVLLSEQPGRLPATIRSRCQKLVCTLPDTAMSRQWLQQQGVEDVDLLLNLAQGAPLLAKRYAEQQIIHLRLNYFEQWLAIAHGKQNLVPIAEQWQKQEQVDLTVTLRWLAEWVTDIVKCALHGETAALQNPDLRKSLQGLAERLELTALYRFYDALLLARAQLSTQLNKQLLLERLLIDWSQLNSR